MGTRPTGKRLPLSTISRVRTLAAKRNESGDDLLRRISQRRRRDNIVVAILAVLAVFGGGHAIVDMLTPDRPPPTDDTAVEAMSHGQLAASFAEDFVVTYLTTNSNQRERLNRFLGDQEQITLPKTAHAVSLPEVVYSGRTTRVGNIEVWTVTISVEVPTPTSNSAGNDNSKSTVNQRQYYRVPVAVDAAQLRALDLPAQIEPPRQGPELAQTYGNPCGPDTALGQVASGFLNAYLTGAGDVARYTTVKSGLSALTPAPYKKLAKVSLNADRQGCGTDGSQTKVLVTVEPETSAGQAASLAYPLTMVRGEGQWQVASIDPSPALQTPLAVVGKGPAQAPGQGPGGSGMQSHSPSATTTAPTTSTAKIPPATKN